MKRLKVSKKLSESIERVKESFSLEWVIARHVKYLDDVIANWSSLGEQFKELEKLSLDEMIRAFYVGYEVVMTPEEELEEIYKKHCENGDCEVVDGIEKTLGILGIKIKGINE